MRRTVFPGSGRWDGRPGGGSADPGAGLPPHSGKDPPAIRRVYKKYPAFVETMSRHHEDYNQDRDELFQAEREGKVLVFAPDSTQGFSRVERDKVKIHALWQQGLDHARARMDEVRAYLSR